MSQDVGDNFGDVFALATRVSYPLEVKMRVIEIRLAGTPVREVGAVLHPK
ncbi:hypothetical protein [Paenibacillus polymyxa]|nr:hypothetical protein [Paenibacillus polymyxa]